MLRGRRAWRGEACRQIRTITLMTIVYANVPCATRTALRDKHNGRVEIAASIIRPQRNFGKQGSPGTCTNFSKGREKLIAEGGDGSLSKFFGCFQAKKLE